MPKNENRLGRINEELKKEISNIISFDLKNPNVTGLISVTGVKITPDLKYAKVFQKFFADFFRCNPFIVKNSFSQMRFIILSKILNFPITHCHKPIGN